MKKITPLFIFFTSLILSACNLDLSESGRDRLLLANHFVEQNKTPEMIEVTGRAVLGISRTALPVMPDNKKYVGSYTNNSLGTFSVNSDGSFSLTIPEGQYKFSIYCQSDDIPAVLYFKYEDTNFRTVSKSSHNFEFLLEPADGTGTVDLMLSVYDPAKIPCADAVWKDDSGTIHSVDISFSSGAGNHFYLTDSNISGAVDSGSYSVDFTFYSDSTKSKPVYRCTEVINVYANLSTTVWQANGTSIHFSGTSNVLYISEDTVAAMKNKVFYVSADGADGNSGTYFAPFKKFQDAIDRIKSLDPSGTEEYTVVIKGELNFIYTDSSNDDNDYAPIGTIAYCPKIVIKGDPVSGGVIKARNTWVFQINNGNIRLQDLTIDVDSIEDSGVFTDCIINFLRGTLELNNVTINRTAAAAIGSDIISTGDMVTIRGETKIGRTRIKALTSGSPLVFAGFVLADIKDTAYSYIIEFDKGLESITNTKVVSESIYNGQLKIFSETSDLSGSYYIDADGFLRTY